MVNDDQDNILYKLEKELNISKIFSKPSFEDWKNSAEKLLKGASFDKKLITKTYEGIELNPIYTKEDIENFKFTHFKPADGNFLRGTKFTEGNSWDICQEIYSNNNKVLNRDLKNALNNGQNTIYLDFDKLNISNIETLSSILSGIDLRRYKIFIKGRGLLTAPTKIFSEYLGKNNLNKEKIFGLFENSPITDLIKYGGLLKPLKEIYDDWSELIKTCMTELPNMRYILIDGFSFHNAGLDSVNELAVSLSIGVEYISKFLERGFSIDEIARKITFSIGIGSNFFMEIAKFRALRVLWGKIIREFEGNAESQKAHIHAKTSYYFQTKLDAFVNTLRTTTQVFSAILGGADTITTSTYDFVNGKETELSRRLARNTQIILKEESNLKRLVDPAGGSYYIETLTKNIIDKAWKKFQDIEKVGGIIEALKSGYIQNKILKKVEERKNDIFKRKSVIIGSNMYANKDDEITDEKESKPQNDDIYIFDKINKLDFSRLSEPYEEIRRTVQNYKEKTKDKLNVIIANYGNIKDYKGKSDFSKEYFEVADFNIIVKTGGETVNNSNLPEFSIAENARVIVISAKEELHKSIITDFVNSIEKLTVKETRPLIILAGNPKDKEDEYRAMGVDNFIYLGSNVLKTLTAVLNEIGVMK